MQNTNDMIKQFEIETKLSNMQREKLLKYFAKQIVQVQIEILKEQKNQFFKLKSYYKESFTLSLSSLIIAINKFYKIEKQGLTKNKSHNIKNIRDNTSAAMYNNRKLRLKIKREKLLNIWSVITQLKSLNYSYREIEDYLKRKHRFEVSHTFIRNTWKEIEDDNN